MISYLQIATKLHHNFHTNYKQLDTFIFKFIFKSILLYLPSTVINAFTVHLLYNSHQTTLFVIIHLLSKSIVKITMNSPKTSTEETTIDTDDLSHLQRKLDDLGTMFYAHLGILQRDAPPIERTPEEKDEITTDVTTRTELNNKATEYAKEILQCHRDITSIITQIDNKVKIHAGRERNLLDTANFESIQAGEEMTEAVDKAQELLTSVRHIISARESEP